jgi:hypothetical protein
MDVFVNDGVKGEIIFSCQLRFLLA